MAQVTNFFVGANSGDGFQNLFPEIVDIEDTYDLMVLKGGPGVGKNTFMRALGQAMEAAGTAVEYLWCSGDPDSLDGVVLPELKCAVADGTSPHGTAPLGHPAKKVSICKALRRRKYYGSSTRHGTNRILLQDKLFEVRRNCSIKKSSFPKSEVSTENRRTFPKPAYIGGARKDNGNLLQKKAWLLKPEKPSISGNSIVGEI